MEEDNLSPLANHAGANLPHSRYLKSRRLSISAEACNFDSDGEEEGSGKDLVVKHPKSDEQLARLNSAITKTFVFKALNDEQRELVIDSMYEKCVAKGNDVIRQGDDGDNFYIVDAGIFEAIVKRDGKSEVVFKYDNSGSFGELALMYNTPRSATVRASTDGVLWTLSGEMFRQIVLKAARKKREEFRKLLQSVTILKELSTYELENVADALILKKYKNGECIFKEGDQAYELYFVLAGAVEIRMLDKSNRQSGQQVKITECPVGSYFGELAWLKKDPRAASAYALGNVTLAELDVYAFERLLGPCREIMERNAKAYEKPLIEKFGSLAM
ncbi:uncharacterized protein TRIADDRAFT_28339 [Trichoplax adhaerens]|uniref:Cyclic nucleotide-binding domain-containing protein n=1 Tax=Trichoplax adhaerens TaxID=10228 RepID=B3S3K3_TRIAD|nr:hypothetical protein TRIADDRAFT_28339 [Trichoplax adhaerens]EDV22812.1 hypothetical protein TRIADDRAFT_28339 [Trichoplax adhaerens]|eukprot:XP_002114678.1 hypothetical protein TRIADDRAFT_28339 [Trichoplax adhaerens]